MRYRTGLWMPLLAAGLLLGCDDAGYDAPEEAEPFEAVAPPPEEALVPGADEPGPQDDEAEDLERPAG